jgi:hypothetical protein
MAERWHDGVTRPDLLAIIVVGWVSAFPLRLFSRPDSGRRSISVDPKSLPEGWRVEIPHSLRHANPAARRCCWV